MTAPKEQKYGVGIIGVAAIAAIVYWWAGKPDPAPAPAPVVVVKDEADEPNKGPVNWYIRGTIDAVLKDFGTDRAKVGKIIAFAVKMVEAAEAKGTSPGELVEGVMKAAEASEKAQEQPPDDPPEKPQASFKLYDYKQTYAVAKRHEAPLLVLVGAEWCAYCKRTYETIDGMILAGEMSNIFAYVDEDKQPDLAAQLKSGDSIPQLVYFRTVDTSGVRHIGEASEATIQALMAPQASPTAVEYGNENYTPRRGLFRRR